MSELQPCGHSKNAIVSSREGTCYCRECEEDARFKHFQGTTLGAIRAAEIITGGRYGDDTLYSTTYGNKTVKGIANIIDQETADGEKMSNKSEKSLNPVPGAPGSAEYTAEIVDALNEETVHDKFIVNPERRKAICKERTLLNMAEELTEIMLRQHVTTEELAERTGIDEQIITNFLRCDGRVKIGDIAQLFASFDMRLNIEVSQLIPKDKNDVRSD